MDVIDRNDLYPQVCEVCSSEDHTMENHRNAYYFVCTIMHTLPGHLPTYSTRAGTVLATIDETRESLSDTIIKDVVKRYVPEGLGYVVMFLSIEPNEL